MRTNRLITVAIATMLLIGGVAAVGAASPADRAAEHATDAYEENSSHETDRDDGANGSETHDERGAPGERASGADERAGNTDGVGPSDGLPEGVPDHVSGIHGTIESFLTGSIDNLGESLNGLLSGGEVTDETPSENSDEGASGSV